MTPDNAQHAVGFYEVLMKELGQISKSRQARLTDARHEEFLVDQQLIGLALSGGGVRSATFSLGVLQGLAQAGLLRRLDYLSSTGGGAEISGWLLRWINASGFHKVEEQLGSKESPLTEPGEIQALRRSLALTKRRSSSFAVIAGLGNVILNWFALGALLATAIFLTRISLEKFASIGFVSGSYWIGAVSTAILLFILSIRKSPASPPSQLRTLLIGVVLSIFAAFLVHDGMSAPWDYGLTEWLIITAVFPFAFVLILGVERRYSTGIFLLHVAAALIASVLTVGLVSLAHLLLNLSFPPTFNYRSTNSWYDLRAYEWSTYVPLIHFAVALVVLAETAALALYASLTKKLALRGTRELFWRVCRTLVAFASVLIIAAMTWMLPFWATVLGILVAVGLTLLGLFKGLGFRAKSRLLSFLFDVLERLAPGTFLIALAGTVAASLMPLINAQSSLGYPFISTIVLVLLALAALLLLWLIRKRELTIHHVHRSSIVRNYLAPAASSVADASATSDVALGSFAESQPEGPYPLFGAALSVTELNRDSSVELRTVPFLFSPLFSGLELPRMREPKEGISEAYRPTNMLAGGISLAGAIAISQPVRGKSFRPPSGATSLLWTIFNMRDGRFMGNPIQNHSWREYGPLIEPLYALREGDPPTEVSFVRPSPSEDFDYLGIYQLVKRHCRFIIACDVTSDPEFVFDKLGKTIFRCRTELGVDIAMELGPFGRTPAVAGTHFQIAQIRYGKGPDGFMVYIKPSLTGDEPTGLAQYARVHSEFPATDVAAGRFGESDFESYRALGQHIVESVFAKIPISREMSTTQVLRQIRRQLQPDFVEPETTQSGAETEGTVVIPPELVESLASGECVLCTGFGLAAQAKLPTWPILLEGLLRKARENGVLDAATANGLASTLAAGELEAAADELTHQVSRDLLLRYVRSVTREARPSRAHELLKEMRFLGALNLSTDELLATEFNARVMVPSQTERLVEALRSKSFFVANLFGTASQPASLLFTMKEFRHLLLANPQLKQFLGTIFLRYTVVFVGLGLNGLRDFMDALELPQTPERKHYVILANAGQIDPVRIRFLERTYNIRVVDYQPGFNYSGLNDFLDELQKTVSENLPSSRTAQALTLKSVTLENIGPFHSLHVDFTPGWNLLLGDNGVGKTIVLKSIAAALCGDKADSDAVLRLLRSGANKGSIRLKDENREYTVSLERSIDGSIQITQASLSPIIHERWLCLGFPALRSIPLVRPKGPRPLKLEGPSPEDLLPLLRGEPDDRIADLKQWLINLDWAIPKEPPPSRSRIVSDDFFGVLQRLIPDVRMEPGPIDAKTMEISVITDTGGKIPLEAVSQGTGSVMCWIGTLLERLSETGKRRDSKQNCALVLIDELDAHMHPKWQRMFVDAFRKEFESVQIIATTHSPLLVGSLKPEEIWSVHRSPLKSEIDGVFHSENVTDGTREIVILGPEQKGRPGPEERRYRLPAKTKLLVNVGDVVEEEEPLTEDNVRVIAERVGMSAEGWRADQILTSPLFELETTRDPETARLLNRYTDLTALQNPSRQQTEELADVAGELKIRMPNAHETEAAREAFELIKRFATESLKELEPEKQEAVLNEVKVQLTESITGSGRNE